MASEFEHKIYIINDIRKLKEGNSFEINLKSHEAFSCLETVKMLNKYKISLPNIEHLVILYKEGKLKEIIELISKLFPIPLRSFSLIGSNNTFIHEELSYLNMLDISESTVCIQYFNFNYSSSFANAIKYLSKADSIQFKN